MMVEISVDEEIAELLRKAKSYGYDIALKYPNRNGVAYIQIRWSGKPIVAYATIQGALDILREKVQDKLEDYEKF